MVPYRSNGAARRAMMARTMSSAGNRALGRMPYRGAGGRAPAPGPGLTYQAPNSLPFIPYEAAKRMHLGGLGESTTQGAAQGAKVGASVGSAIPLIGTAVGAILGGIGGAIASAFSRSDQEVQNFDQAVALWQVNPDNVYNIVNKYLALAGLFDLKLNNPHIPIYQRYGRMGEQRFVTDLVNLIYSAAQKGKIGPADTPMTIMSRIVQPWIDSWGFGPMVDPHSDLINRLIIGMILDYIAGRKGTWNARGGDNPFTALPNFSLPQPVPPPAAVAAPTAAPSVVPQIVVTPSAQAASPAAPPPAPVVTISHDQTGMPVATVTGAPPPPPTVAPTTAQVPSGFNQVAVDQAGNPVFSNAQGVLYSWNGAAMTQFTGQLASASSQAAQVQAAIQSALAQGYSAAQAAQAAIAQQQAAGAQVPPAILAQAPAQAAVTAAAPSSL